MSTDYLLVGLGNPGKKYDATRHNVGFWLADEVSDNQYRDKFSGQLSASTVPNLRWILKPQTFMNLSGDSIVAASQFFRVSPENIIVVHDELDLPIGTVRIKFGGGEAGHNGLKSASSRLGSRDYIRIRIGIGRPDAEFKGTVADYVLKEPPPDELNLLRQGVHRGVEAVRLLCKDGLQNTMNEFNGK